MGIISEYREVNKLISQKLDIVIYSESAAYLPYFEQLIADLLLIEGVHITYITSDKQDPAFQKKSSRFNCVYVKWMLGFLFSRMQASVMIMTMPDLGNFLFKRSPGVTSYIYIFHAAVSTHQQYSREAFFNYDAVFCIGLYQEQEIRKAETLYNLPSKELIAYGYPLFDAISKKRLPGTGNKPTVLIAPSWFDGCLLDTGIETLLVQLSKLPYKVVLRTHPEYARRKKKEFKKIAALVNKHAAMEIDTNTSVLDSLPAANYLITDRSGIALEYAFGLHQPVLFIDTVLKINNPDIDQLGIEPLENRIRTDIGLSLGPDELHLISEKLEALSSLLPDFPAKASKLYAATFYDSKTGSKAAIDYILSKRN